MTISEPVKVAPGTPDASDVVMGPVGSARLREPVSAGPEGVELDRLPAIDVGADDLTLVSSSSGSSSPGYDPNGAVRQLDVIIQNLTTHATPVLREIAARAAELAAKAGEAAGPLAHKAATVTEQVGGRVATKGLELAAELRQQRQQRREETGRIAADTAGESSAAWAEPSDGGQAPRAVEAGLPARS